MRVLVTGGAGFIGSHVADKLRDRGIAVRVFDLFPPGHRDDLEYYQGSLLDMDQLRAALRGVDAVMHLAAVADVNDVLADPHHAETVNVRGTINVLEAMRRARVNRLVFGSTTWVYSDAVADEVDEDTPLRPPSNLYTATKLAAEYYCHAYAVQYGLEPTILRYGIPYGPRARPGAVVPVFVEQARSRRAITIAGDGSQFRKFVYVEDLAEGNVLALTSKAINRTYNLDGTERVTIRQIADAVCRLVRPVEVVSGPPRGADFAGKEVSSLRALREIGWKAKIPFEEGLRRYVNWYLGLQETVSGRSASLDEMINALPAADRG